MTRSITARSTTGRRTAVRIRPNSPSAATGVPLTTDDQATGIGQRLQDPQSASSHGTFEQLRLW